uniref:Uncharacterized protein n=1 Tax=Anguilla anguilla TaxID=7936 RepID=A0A0E9TR57_ANGAN
MSNLSSMFHYKRFNSFPSAPLFINKRRAQSSQYTSASNTKECTVLYSVGAPERPIFTR